MSIDLQTFASGDLDYIAKLNANEATVEAAINALQNAQAGVGGAMTIGLFMDALFSSTTTLIGGGSYKPTADGTTLDVAAGSAYKDTTQSVVQSIATDIPFVGQPAATYYIVPDATGTPTRSDSPTDAVYTVVWTGSAFGAITRVAPALFDGSEQDDARISALLGSFASLSERLDAEAAAEAALIEAAQSTADTALALAYELGGDVIDGFGDVFGPASSVDDRVATFDGTTGKLIQDSGTTVAAIIAAASGAGGDVDGPASSVDDRIATFDGTTGKLLQDGGATIAGVISAAVSAAGAGDVVGPASAVDDRLATFDGVTGKLIQDGGSTIAAVIAAAVAAVPKPRRKVGCSLDGGGVALTTGVKGQIQVDFAGTIIGWSLIGDQSGSISVDVDLQASSAPPAAPGIPDTTGDKISASAPIAVSGAQSAAGGTSAVSTWTTTIAQWDVIQFNVTAVTTLTKATLYILIQET